MGERGVGWMLGLLMCTLGGGLGVLAWQANSHSEAPSAAAASLPRSAAPVALAPAEQVKQSLAQAEPLLGMLRAGMVVSDEEIVDADVGIVEPWLMAQAAHHREMVALAVAYETVIGGPEPEQMLQPASLASASHRAFIREIVRQRTLAAATYKRDLQAATLRGRARLSSALQQMPAGSFASALDAFDQAMAPLTAYVDGLDSTARHSGEAMDAVLDFVERERGVRLVQSGRVLRLEFQSPEAAAEYQRRLSAVTHALARERHVEASFVGTPVFTSGSLSR
jgi:hypothetical protein